MSNLPTHAKHELDFSVVDIPIGGKLLQARLELNWIEQFDFKSDEVYKQAIKEKVAFELALAMIQSKAIEFTHLTQPSTGTDTIYARCYLAPSDQVKVLRMHYAKPIRP
jgi:hypothetical protein